VAITLAAARIARPGLARRLGEAFDSGSVLLVAGAGYGKTMALEEAIERSGRRAVWLSCGDSGGDAGRLLMATMQELRGSLPGLVDVVGERMSAGLEPLDVGLATRVLLSELERLLVEPLVIVFDDAEELEDAPEALALVDQLLGVRSAPLSLAIATRRPLPLRLAKLRAAGRLAELGPPELSFTASECAELLSLRHGRTLTEEEIEAVVAASEGWPMGVALSGLTNGAPAGSVPRGDLFHYLAEEVLDRLDPAMRAALVDSSVPDTLTPELVRDLGLPPDFLDQAERSGLFLRTTASGARTYHPLFRGFLRERLEELRSEAELATLHERAAASLVAAGRPAQAIEHWLEAGRFDQALADLSTYGGELLRTSPGTVSSWLEAMPGDLRGEPDYLLLQGQLLWGSGQTAQSLEPLRAAVSGFEAAGNADRAWFARVFECDALVFTSAFADVAAVAEGWEEASGPIAAAAAMAVAWYEAVACAALGRIEEYETLRARLQQDEQAAAPFTFLASVARSGLELAAGPARDAQATLRSAVAELEFSDPFGRLPYTLGMYLCILRDLGEREAALEWVDRCESEAERVGLFWARRDFGLQRASLLAQMGDLPHAEMELAQAGNRSSTGWRVVYEAEAEAHVAILRGDGPAAAAAAQRALKSLVGGPLPWRVLSTVELARVLADAGAPGQAVSAIETTLASVDKRLPGQPGRHHRAWLLAARACLEYKTGEADAALDTMGRCWREAGDEVGRMVRAHWPWIKPVLWHALAVEHVSPEAVLTAMQDAFPGGEALVVMLDHPEPAARRAALLAALAADHPIALARLGELGEDPDEQVAGAAAAARERLRSEPPPLRFELLGGFRVRRAGWQLDEGVWQRPMAARVVRFLLIQGSIGVPEDTLFDAFWSDRDADSARQHLAQAVSRARRVLDLPDADQSVIEAKERTFRLRLRERDSVDVYEFEDAAAAALDNRGPGRRAALEAAAALWTGEPLPEDRYAEWLTAWVERLIHTYSQVLTAIVESCVAAGDHHEAIHAARRLLELDPLDEHAHRELMLAYARTGRTSQALRQFLECRRALVTDLGVEPAAETSRLQARILAGEPV
jgi:ATP/maltotriose-dependent transcriptional regulator MalT/DNA-binding SARP family transcriptional activator